MARPVVNKFDLTLNLSIALFVAGLILGFTEFFKAYLGWLNVSVILSGNLIFLFVSLYIFSSTVVGIRDFPDRKGLPGFILTALIAFIGTSLLYAYVLVIGLVYIFDFMGGNLLGTLTPSMLEQMAAANNMELSLKDSDALEVVTGSAKDATIFNKIFTAKNYIDVGLIGVGIFLVFASGFVIYAIKSTNFSFSDCIEEVYLSADAAFKGLIRFLPLFALLVGMAAALNLGVSFNDESLLTWVSVFIFVTLAMLITVAVFISLLAKQRFIMVIKLLQLSISSLGAPSIFLMFPLLYQMLVQHLGITRSRIQVLLPSALLLCNMGIVLSCVLLLALTIQFSPNSSRSLLDLISPAVVLLDQAQALSFDLAGMLTQFNKRLELGLGLNSGMYIPLTVAFLPMLVILARPLSIMFVMIVAVVVARSSGDDFEAEDFGEIKDEQLFVVDVSPIIMFGITTCTVLSILIVLAVGYSIAMTGIFLLE